MNKKGRPEIDAILKDLERNMSKRRVQLFPAGAYRRGVVAMDRLHIVFVGSIADVEEILHEMEGITPVGAPRHSDRVLKAYVFGGFEIWFHKAYQSELGSMLLHHTGSITFNILLASEAKKQGMKLTPTGLWQGEVQIAGREERQVFKALGLKYVEPKKRDITPADAQKGQVLFYEDIRDGNTPKARV